VARSGAAAARGPTSRLMRPAGRPAAAAADAAAGVEVPRRAVPASREPSLVIREPVRSGQVIYAEGRDLIVMAPVNSGAQLLADGNIHVYAPLRGRAVAGAHGARDAQVFCLSLEAELVGVDATYVTSDGIDPAVWGGPARVFVNADGDCAIDSLPGSKAGPHRTGSPLRSGR